MTYQPKAAEITPAWNELQRWLATNVMPSEAKQCMDIVERLVKETPPVMVDFDMAGMVGEGASPVQVADPRLRPALVLLGVGFVLGLVTFGALLIQ